MSAYEELLAELRACLQPNQYERAAALVGQVRTEGRQEGRFETHTDYARRATEGMKHALGPTETPQPPTKPPRNNTNQ